MIEIDARTTIPAHELWYEFSHASGPGGQHVNKASTRASLCFAPARSGALSDSQKQRICQRLRPRLSREGVLRVDCDETRSQARNREIARARLRELLQNALRRQKKRRPTRPSRGAVERRLDEKHHRGQIKRKRRRINRRNLDEDV